ncbi:MAG: hypothetical protein IT214_10855 [Chitinophagaceae bacterium]|jgi:hypothetical protein|nr:hypothetical protein [Chitinophagaceae bacterium]
MADLTGCYDFISYAGLPAPHQYYIALSDEAMLTDLKLQLPDDESLRKLDWEHKVFRLK